MIHNPKVLYLDEPTIGLDLVVKDKIRQAIKHINQQYNTTVVLTTHDLGDIEELCNRIIIIDNGKLIYDGTIEELRDKYGIIRTIEIEVKNTDKIQKINYNQFFNVNEKDLSVDITGNSLNFSFNKNVIEVSKIISKVMSDAEVKDIKIKETELSDIVKQIYVHGI